jgi:N-methylhydantoinase A/oxoprolinase/acetone carboxylase beta subunit
MAIKDCDSLARAEITLKRPVETIISIPTEKIIGACYLSQSSNSIIVDMDGTTANITIITNRQLDVIEKATLIGD